MVKGLRISRKKGQLFWHVNGTIAPHQRNHCAWRIASVYAGMELTEPYGTIGAGFAYRRIKIRKTCTKGSVSFRFFHSLRFYVGLRNCDPSVARFYVGLRSSCFFCEESFSLGVFLSVMPLYHTPLLVKRS